MIAAIAIILVLGSSQIDGQRPIVHTTSGYLRGISSEVNAQPLMKFLGVPYAKIPQRFSAAVEPEDGSEETIDAARFRASCMQPPHLRKVIYRPLHDDLDDAMVSEDCLNLNLYVPGRRINESSRSEEKMAVMVWLPGEGFDYGYANQYDASRLATHGRVIVATVNYRLSVFGFLSTGDTQAPGNMGLMDQMMALRWLKKNVAQLGGDPERITLFGRLTGSMSISALMFSTLEGPKLFHRAILQSGIAQGEWAFEKEPLEQALSIARSVGCGQVDLENVNTTRLVSCLRKVPAKNLLKAAIRAPRPWRLTIDGQFLVETPLKRVSEPAAAAAEKKIDLMLGTTEHEGSVCLLSHLVQKTEYMDKFINNTLSNDDLRALVHSHIDNFYGFRTNGDLRTVVHNLYRCAGGADCRENFINFCGDLYSHSSVTQLAELASTSGANVFRYEFAHRPTFSHYPEFVRAAQGDEVLFVFGLVDERAKLENVTLEEIRLGHQMMTMWTNFAKTGNPNTFQKDMRWPRYNEHGQYLRISRKMGPESVQKSTINERINFWMDFNQKPSSSS